MGAAPPTRALAIRSAEPGGARTGASQRRRPRTTRADKGLVAAGAARPGRQDAGPPCGWRELTPRGGEGLGAGPGTAPPMSTPRSATAPRHGPTARGDADAERTGRAAATRPAPTHARRTHGRTRRTDSGRASACVFRRRNSPLVAGAASSWTHGVGPGRGPPGGRPGGGCVDGLPGDG